MQFCIPVFTAQAEPGFHLRRFIRTYRGEKSMALIKRARESGKIGWILLWLLGVPIPVLFLLFLVRGCT